MKGQLLTLGLIASFFIYSCGSETDDQELEIQACDNGTYVGDVILSSQQEVEEFGALCYSIIEGDLIIGFNDNVVPIINESDIIDLSPLSNLIEVKSDLHIAQNPLLQNLQGLNNLNKANSLQISWCNQLIDMQGLENLTNANSLGISRNDNLESLSGLNLISPILNDMIIFDNLNLTSITQISFLESVNGTLKVSRNDNLQSLSGLDNVGFCNSLDIEENNSITSLNGLENLIEVGYRAWIFGNENLESVQGLDNLVQVQDFRVQQNPNIVNINGLESLISVTSHFQFFANENLSDFCSIQNIIANGTYHPDYFIISNNAYNPSANDILTGNCSL